MQHYLQVRKLVPEAEKLLGGCGVVHHRKLSAGVEGHMLCGVSGVIGVNAGGDAARKHGT